MTKYHFNQQQGASPANNKGVNMLGWLYRVIIGRFGYCQHTWKILCKGQYTGDFGNTGNYYDLQCTKCGKIKSKYL
jgi:hypothetical protein